MDQTPILAELLRTLIELNKKPVSEYPLRSDICDLREQATLRLEELHIWLSDLGAPAHALEAISQAVGGVLVLRLREFVRCDCGGSDMSPHPKMFEVWTAAGKQLVCERELKLPRAISDGLL